MNTINFNELAEYCVNRRKKSCNIYKGTLYVAISSDDKVHCSNTTHILSYASKLILIHTICNKEGYYGRTWYELDYIAQDGSVTEGFLGNGLRLHTVSGSTLYLYHELSDYAIPIKEWSNPFENKMQEIWDICCKFKNAKTKEEAKLLIDTLSDEETHHKLKEEIDLAYKALDELNQKYRDFLDRMNKLIG